MAFRSEGANLKCSLTVRQAAISLFLSFSTTSLPVPATNYPRTVCLHVHFGNNSPHQQCRAHIAQPAVQTHGRGSVGPPPPPPRAPAPGAGVWGPPPPLLGRPGPNEPVRSVTLIVAGKVFCGLPWQETITHRTHRRCTKRERKNVAKCPKMVINCGLGRLPKFVL